jgi:hypothetical protein
MTTSMAPPSMKPPSSPLPDYDPPPQRRRRRLSVWTVLAPAALVAVVVLLFSALGSSCAFKDCGADKAAVAGDTPAEEALAAKRKAKPQLYAKDGKLKPRWKVREGQSAQAIADDFELTMTELRACNPQILDFRQIRPGQFVQVDHKHCKGAEPADAGAEVDPEAGTPAEVAAGTGTKG